MADRKENNLNVFTSKIDNFVDLAKDYLFQVQIICPDGTKLKELAESIYGEGAEGFTLRAKSITTPKKSFGSALETNYMGSKKTYPGRAEMNGEVSIKFDEFQDMLTSQFLHQWQGMIYNHTINEDNAGDIIGLDKTGGASSNYLGDYTCKIKIIMYDSTLKKRLPNSWVLYQCWPNSLDGFSLDAGSSNKVERTCNFTYNTFQMLVEDNK